MTTCPNCQFTNHSSLSPREAETVQKLASGMSADEIADTMFKSKKTVYTYWYRAKKKLGLKSIGDLHRAWATRRMISVPDIERSPEYREGYTQALADSLTPDMGIFK